MGAWKEPVAVVGVIWADFSRLPTACVDLPRALRESHTPPPGSSATCKKAQQLPPS